MLNRREFIGTSLLAIPAVRAMSKYSQLIPSHLRGPAPKQINANIAYREELLALARGNEEVQEWAWLRCKRDPFWYTNTFLWTYDPKKFAKRPVRPLILYDFQEVALKKFLDALGIHDVVVKKSRDMGATTIALVAFEHPMHFEDMQTFLLVSRNQDAVDKKNDSDSLFWKLDFMLENQPGWLQPKPFRKSLSLLYEDTDSVAIGASTTGDAGRGGRKVAALLDEFAAVTRGDDYAMLSATRDATFCRIINSTPKGSGGAYADQLEKYERMHPEWVLTMHWSQHPLKVRGAYIVHVMQNGSVDIEIVDKAWHAKHPGYKFVTKGPFFWNHQIRSPWYDLECDRAASPVEIAQELDMKMAESAYQYFDAAVLARLREKHSCQPYVRGEIIWDNDDLRTARFDPTENGRVFLWFHPTPHGQCPWTDICVGADVGTGKGGDMSSNSVASGTRGSTGEKIVEFAVNTLSPFEFCDYTIALCYWLGTAFLIYEDQGPGVEFTRRLRDGYRYSNVYRRDVDDKSLSKKKNKKLGFFTTHQTKQALLADYRSALATERFVNHSDEALAECGQYEVLPTGEIQHSKSIGAQDPNSRGKNHGDRVISDALSWRGIQDRGGQGSSGAAPPPVNVPENCALSRRRRRELASQSSQSW